MAALPHRIVTPRKHAARYRPEQLVPASPRLNAALATCRAKGASFSTRDAEKRRHWIDTSRCRRAITGANVQALRFGFKEKIGLKVWREVLARYGEKCLRCGSIDFLTIDHAYPISIGGRNHVSNLQPLCSACNAWKSNRYIDYRPDCGAAFNDRM